MSIEKLLGVGKVDPAEKFPPLPEGAEVVGDIPEWLRPWFPFDSFVKATFEPMKRRIQELQSSDRFIGPDSPEADEISKGMAVAQEIVDARKAVFSAGLKQHLLDVGKFEECAIQVCEGWKLAMIPLPLGNNPLEAILLSALLGQMARA